MKDTYKLQNVVCVHLLFHNLCVTRLSSAVAGPIYMSKFRYILEFFPLK